MKTKIVASLLALSLTAMSIAGCSDSKSNSAEQASDKTQEITIENCGKKVTLDKHPDKVLSMGTTGLAFLIAAGGKDKIMGRANEFGEPPAKWIGKKADDIKIVADAELSMESLISLKPDFVYGGGFSSTGLPPEDVKAKGIPAVVDQPECHYFYKGLEPEESFDTILKEIESLGKVLGTSEEASQTASDLRDKIKKLEEKKVGKGQKVTYAYYYGDDKDLFSYGNLGVMADINKTLDLNVAIDPNYHPHQGALSQEAFVDSNPDMIIVLVGMGGATKESSLKRLEAIPGFKDMKAVKDGKVYYTEAAMTWASPTALYGTLDLAKEIEK